jgi:hypothetical protein
MKPESLKWKYSEKTTQKSTNIVAYKWTIIMVYKNKNMEIKLKIIL